MFVALDLETTGLDAENDKIIEIAIVKVDSKTFDIIDKFTTLINPGIEIPSIITNITSISNEDVMLSPFIDEIKDKIIEFIGDYPIMGHNISFDLAFLEKENLYFKDNIILDTFYLSNFLSYNENSLSLESLCNSYKIEFTGAHRALNDIIVNVKLFEILINKIKKLNKKQSEILKYIISKTNDNGLNYILDKYVNLNVNLIDSTIFLKYLLKIFPEYNSKHKIHTNKDIKNKDSKKILSTLKGLEIRNNQEKMLDIVDNCLDKNMRNVIEAPTGLGKTFAYLTPSIIYSLKNSEQVFISTTTKALQDQIFYKDLKFLKANLGFDFSYSKLKGKRNYFSIFSFINYLGTIEYFSLKQSSFILKILFWLHETKSFELDELDLYGEEFNFINYINADNSVIFTSNNIYEKREPILNARKKAKNSNIVIVNNSLLFQDIQTENNILGKIKNLVLDEAHNLEDIVTTSLKKSFNIKDLSKIFNNIKLTCNKNKYSLENIDPKIEDLLFKIQIIFDTFELYLNSKIDSNSNYKNVLLGNDFYNNNIDNFDINNIYKSIKSDFLSIIDELKILPDELYVELSKDINFLENIIDIIDKVLDRDSSNLYIRTINYSNYRGLYIEYSLLNVGEFLNKNLWSKLDSCILTSATLSIDNNFGYIKNILNLDTFDIFKLESDFDYKKQALVYIPNDLGNIKNNFDQIIDFLKEFILIVRGQTLILFTALYLIKKVYTEIGAELKKNGINLYAQNISGGKNKILGFYKDNYNNSVIFGTDTFWEGIDLIGDELKFLIIHKIPFMVPTDPIFQARSKLFKDSFSEYSIPKAIIKLKQGFGRLIRSKDDSGVIIFLDDRIINTSWGNKLLEAFPLEINLKIGKHKGLLNVLKNTKKQENKK